MRKSNVKGAPTIAFIVTSDKTRARWQAAGAIGVLLFAITKITFLVLFIGINEYGWWS